MHGWFRTLIKSRKTLSTQHESAVTENPVTSVSTTSALSSSVSSSPRTTSYYEPLQSKNVLSSELRWRQKYDVFVCHSSEERDIEEAKRLVSFLEDEPRRLRCFLFHRDTIPGGAVSTEFCQAVQSCHVQALLITPSFLVDDWCSYVMHQALAEGPMSNRLIPLVQNLSHSQYPQEMRFYYYIDLSKNPDRGFYMVYQAVYRYFENLVRKERTRGFNLGESRCGVTGSGGIQECKVVSKLNPAETTER